MLGEGAVNRGISFDEAGGTPRIRELEVSITRRCNLACAQCGFMVPDQPSPALGDVAQEAAAGIAHLGRLGIRIGTLVVLGGEPTLDGGRLVRVLRALRGVGNFDRLEVVSNGLHPQGLTTEALQYIDRFVVSVYFDDSALSELWSRWLAAVAPHVELQLRLHADGWDRWTGDERVDDARAQQLYDACWYRKHCVTVERGRLFACSRIPKLARDAEGLPLTDDVTLASVTDYLNRNRFLPSCQTCVPMMELGTVTPGVQPDGRLVRLTTRAIRVLAARVSAAESQSGADP